MKIFEKGIWIGQLPSRSLAKKVVRKLVKYQVKYYANWKEKKEAENAPENSNSNSVLNTTQPENANITLGESNPIKIKDGYGVHLNVFLTKEEYEQKLCRRLGINVARNAINLLSVQKNELIKAGGTWQDNSDYKSLTHFDFIERAKLHTSLPLAKKDDKPVNTKPVTKEVISSNKPTPSSPITSKPTTKTQSPTISQEIEERGFVMFWGLIRITNIEISLLWRAIKWKR